MEIPLVIDFILNNKEWIFSGIGIFLISVAVTFVKIFINRRKLSRTGADMFVGIYEVYQFRIRNNGTFLKSKIKISKSFSGNLVVELESVRYRYKGIAKIRGHNIYLYLSGLNHDGYLHCIFKEPLSSFDILFGVYSGITSSRLPVCGKLLMRRHGLNDYLQVTPAFLRASEVPRKIKQLLESTTENLIIVDDLPVYLFEELK